MSLDSEYRDELASLVWIISVASTGNLLSMKSDTTEVRCLLDWSLLFLKRNVICALQPSWLRALSCAPAASCQEAEPCCGAAQPYARNLMNTLHGFGSYPDLGDDEHYTLAKVYRDAARVCGHNADIDGFLQCMSSGPDKGACLACLLSFCARWRRQ